MMTRWLLASLHLLALPIGIGAVIGRGGALRRLRDSGQLSSVFRMDNWWGVAALLWLVTGLLRAFAGFEKGTAYYLGNPLFHAKLGLFGVVLLLELWPMVTLIRWRLAVRRGRDVDTSVAPRLARISMSQAAVVVVILFLATGIARGLGA